jgi:hypothetical protein
MSDDNRGIERRLNVDFVMSACALLISAVACAASIYQLHNAAILMSAQTWPYVTIGWHIGTDESEIVVANDGQGSAIFHGTVLRIDNRPQHDVLTALRGIVSGSTGVVQMDALVRGVVLRPGQSLRLIGVHGAGWDKQLREAKSRIAVDLCYCSILDRCWTSAIDELPKEVAHCDESSNLTMPDLNDATTPGETGGN